MMPTPLPQPLPRLLAASALARIQNQLIFDAIHAPLAGHRRQYIIVIVHICTGAFHAVHELNHPHPLLPARACSLPLASFTSNQAHCMMQIDSAKSQNYLKKCRGKSVLWTFPEQLGTWKRRASQNSQRRKNLKLFERKDFYNRARALWPWQFSRLDSGDSYNELEVITLNLNLKTNKLHRCEKRRLSPILRKTSKMSLRTDRDVGSLTQISQEKGVLCTTRKDVIFLFSYIFVQYFLNKLICGFSSHRFISELSIMFSVRGLKATSILESASGPGRVESDL